MPVSKCAHPPVYVRSAGSLVASHIVYTMFKEHIDEGVCEQVVVATDARHRFGDRHVLAAAAVARATAGTINS